MLSNTRLKHLMNICVCFVSHTSIATWLFDAFLVFICRSFLFFLFFKKPCNFCRYDPISFKCTIYFSFCFPLLFSIPSPKNERGFQKQGTIFLSKKGGLKKTESRFIRNPGLGFKIPREVRTIFSVINNKEDHNFS